MKSRFSKAVYPLGLTVFVICLAVYKAVILSGDMGAGGYAVLLIVGLDALFLSILFLVALLQSFVSTNRLRIVLGLIQFALALVYLIDCFVLLALDQHASMFDLVRYLPEWGVVQSFFDWRAYLALFLLPVSAFISLDSTRSTRKAGLFLLVASLLAGGLSTLSAPQNLRHYAILSPAQVINTMVSPKAVERYSDAEIKFYAGLERETVNIPESRPNIVLVVVESLSSINSWKTSAGLNLLEGFDELAEEGTLFTNFFANHQASEGGLIALLGGFPPIHFPTASPYMFDEFAIQASVIAEYQEKDYRVEFLTNADLGFIGLDRFLSGLGIDRSRGRDEVEAMKFAPAIVQDAPSDAFLYHEALVSIGQLMEQDSPFLLTVATTSTHLPYTHPEGGPDTAEAVWDWSMGQLASFYTRLSESGFFKHGILLITGDHRQMRPLTRLETERYGASARARVPLLVIGANYPKGRIDKRFFQQSDLLRKLGIIDQADVMLSPHPIWVERYNRKYGRPELINNLGIFDEADQGRSEYRMIAPGNRIEWLDKRPPFARQVETAIHTQRSLHQQARSRMNSSGTEKD